MLALEPTGWPPTVAAEMGAYRFAANGAISCSYCSAFARGAESVCGCVSEHISETTGPNFTNFPLCVIYGRGSAIV